MKNRNLLAGLSLAFAIGLIIIGLIQIISHHNEKPANLGVTQSACQIFPTHFARTLLGPTTTPSDKNKTSVNKDARLSQCTYFQNPDQSGLKATLSVHSPRTEATLNTYRSIFNDSKSRGLTQLKVYGQASFWDPKTGQINIFKHQTWYVLTIGPDQASARTLSQTETMADLIITRL